MYENRIRDRRWVVLCDLHVTGLRDDQWVEHDGRRHYGDNVCVLPTADDPAKAAARERLRSTIRREQVGA